MCQREEVMEERGRRGIHTCTHREGEGGRRRGARREKCAPAYASQSVSSREEKEKEKEKRKKNRDQRRSIHTMKEKRERKEREERRGEGRAVVGV